MKERPILFCADMVQAYLERRKRQTRRIIKPEWYRCLDLEDPDDAALALTGCPYGKPGDSLWVKETWRIVDRDFDPGIVRVGYKATPEPNSTDSRIYTQVWSPWIEVGNEYAEKFNRVTDRERNKWRPSIFMPRWASRIQFPILRTWIEPVQEISEADAIAEGVAPNWCGPLDGWSPTEHGYMDYSVPLDDPDCEGYGECLTARESYRTLWDKINKRRGYGWGVAPWWVWVIEFPEFSGGVNEHRN